MNKKRIISLVATFAVVATLFAGCQSNPAPSPSTTPTAKKFKVGLSTDQGGLNDKSFNQAADTGIKKAQTDLGNIDYKAIESKQKEDYEPNLDALVSDGNDLVFGVGFQMETAIENMAQKYPAKKFAIIDSVAVDKNNKQLPNVESIMFKEQEGSFLVGVIAGKVSKAHKIGFIGGIDGELIQRFETGFAAGVKAVDPTAAKGLIDRTEVRYAASFDDVNKGYELAKSLINDGCDVIYHAAGGVGIGMFKAVKEANAAGKKVWAIGVDQDQAATVPEYKDIILTSCMKRVDSGTYEVTKEAQAGQFKGGTQLILGLKEDGVGIAPSSNVNVPADVLSLEKKYEDAIKAGTIVVPAKKGEAANFTAPSIQ
jgi:basic membrane protein A